MVDMQEVIFCEQRSMATKWFRQAIRKADARKIGFLEVPYILRHHVFVIILQNAAGIAFHVFILSLFDCPNHYCKKYQAQERHAGN
jgi:hypothetical protein